MKRSLIFATLAIAVSLTSAQTGRNTMQEELLKIEKDFSLAVVANDAEAVGRFLADEWVMIDPDGGIIDKARFVAVMKSGALTHELMESDDIRVRIYGDTAIVTALTTTRGKYSGQAFTTQERATDVFVKHDGRWQCALSQLTKFVKK